MKIDSNPVPASSPLTAGSSEGKTGSNVKAKAKGLPKRDVSTSPSIDLKTHKNKQRKSPKKAKKRNRSKLKTTPNTTPMSSPKSSSRPKISSGPKAVASDEKVKIDLSNMLEKVLKASTDRKKAKDNGYVHVESEDTYITLENLDSVLFQLGGSKDNPNDSDAFMFFFSCLRRCQRFCKDSESQPKHVILGLNETSSILISHLYLTCSDDAGIYSPHLTALSRDAFMRLTLATGALGRPLPKDFLRLFMEAAAKDTTVIHPIIHKMMGIDLSGKFKAFSVEDAVNASIAIKRFLPYPCITKFVGQHPLLNPVSSDAHYPIAHRLQNESLLGPLLQVACKPEDPEFANALHRVSAIETHVANVHQSLDDIQDSVHLLVKKILATKNLPPPLDTGKQRLFPWLGNIARGNLERRKMRFNPSIVSSDAFMSNLGGVLARLCIPFVRKKLFKSIDIGYLADEKSRLEFKGLTRLSVKESEIAEIFKTLVKTNSNKTRDGTFKTYSTVTEMLFITQEILHLGFFKHAKKLTDFTRQYNQIHQYLDSIGGPHSNHPTAQEAREKLSLALSNLLCLRAQLLPPVMMKTIAILQAFVAEWISTMIVQHQDIKVLGLVPEYYISDMIEFWTLHHNATRSQTRFAWYDSVVQYYVDLAILVMQNGSPVRNPHLRGMIPEMLDLIFSKVDMEVVLKRCKFQARLLESAVDLYVEIEDGENQYHGKFTTRFFISKMLYKLWEERSPVHELKNLDNKKTLRFVNMLANDNIWLLDESLRRLEDIHQFQQKEKKGDIKENERRDIARLEKECQSMMSLAKSCIDLMHQISRTYVDALVDNVMCPRMSGMVSYYINKLNGTQVSDLKVNNPRKYHFRPKELMRSLVGLFINLSTSQRFLECVAEDERSYDAKVFDRAAKAIVKKNIVDKPKALVFQNLIAKVDQIASSKANQQQQDEDIPERFLDPLMASVMREPVKLPTSGMVMDKGVILRHLLNKENDPFNRKKLTPDMLQELPDLKKEIEDFLAKRTDSS